MAKLLMMEAEEMRLAREEQAKAREEQAKSREEQGTINAALLGFLQKKQI
jgi:hypothetical protein